VLATDVGKALALAGFTICNGGYGGTMEAAARGAREAQGHTIGVITKFFAGSAANAWIERVEIVETFVDRLMRLISLGDAYVVLKGGTGTLLELAAVWEMMNKNVLPQKPIVAVGGFWDGVLKTLQEELAREGPEHCADFVTAAATPSECAAFLKRRMKGEP
jgi:uncharacterized protein (TIGR00730 family)